MLVIAVAVSGQLLRWRGRRHDDVSRGAASGDTVTGLFDAVFHALHDGEQVAVGFPAPLGIAGVTTDESGLDLALTRAEQGSAVVRQLVALLSELGKWRSWTVVSTSLARWHATTSVLIWATDLPNSTGDGDLDDAVESFYGVVGDRTGRDAESSSGMVINLAALAARRAQLNVDPAQLRESIVFVARPGVAAT